jgi:hypothetical protein
MKEWFEIVELVAPCIVKIETPQGHGTGFLCAYNEEKTWTAIATAHHVVEYADKWQQPIRLHNVASATTVLLQEGDRVIIPDPNKDSAVIIALTTKIAALELPQEAVGLIKTGKRMKVGVEVAWLGYPSIGPDTLCYFAGSISAWQKTTSSYLIDGVAINGVSGGPVFARTADGVHIIGAISAYMPNRLTSGILPGLSIAQDVSHFQKIVIQIKDKDEANRKKKEEEAKQAAGAATS